MESQYDLLMGIYIYIYITLYYAYMGEESIAKHVDLIIQTSIRVVLFT